MSDSRFASEDTDPIPDSAYLLGNESYQKEKYRKPSRWKSSSACLLTVNIIILLISMTCLLASLALWQSSKPSHSRNWLLKATSNPSPILEQIDIPVLSKKMNGTFLETGTKDIFRQDPSPEVDAAWDRIQTRDGVPISRLDVIRLGKDPDDAAKFPESFGFGNEAYIAKVDVFHQIHCLNTLRMNLRNNFDYYYGSEFPNGTATTKFHDLHVSHCLVTLLENIKCAGNVDLYTHRWVDAQVHPYADFNMVHQCRDFDAILAWQEKHAVPMHQMMNVTKPKNAKVHIMSHEFKEVMGWYKSHPDDHTVNGEDG